VQDSLFINEIKSRYYQNSVLKFGAAETPYHQDKNGNNYFVQGGWPAKAPNLE
jgi:hypothetical protein